MAAWREDGRFLRCTACNWTTIPVCSRCEHWASSHPPEDDGCAEAGCGCTEYVGPLSPPAAGPSGGEVPSVACPCIQSDPICGAPGCIGFVPSPLFKSRAEAGAAAALAAALGSGPRGGTAPTAPAPRAEVSDAIPLSGIRRCKTEVPGEEDDDPPRPCDTVLGSDLRCDVCGGLRCYMHCGSIDHLPGAIPLSLGAAVLGADRSLTWKLIRVTGDYGELYWGEVRRLRGETIEGVPLKISAPAEEEVARQIRAFVQAACIAPAPEPPRVAPLGNLRARLAESGDPDPCSEADLFDPENWQGVAPEAMARGLALPSPGEPSTNRRRRVAGDLEVEILSWELAWRELAELAAVDPVSIARAKALHDACVVSLLSRLGGAL